LVASGVGTCGFRRRQALPPPADTGLRRRTVGGAVGPVPASPHGRAVPRLGLRGNGVPATNLLETIARSAVSHLACEGFKGSLRAKSEVAEDCTELELIRTTGGWLQRRFDALRWPRKGVDSIWNPPEKRVILSRSQIMHDAFATGFVATRIGFEGIAPAPNALEHRNHNDKSPIARSDSVSSQDYFWLRLLCCRLCRQCVVLQRRQ